LVQAAEQVRAEGTPDRVYAVSGWEGQDFRVFGDWFGPCENHAKPLLDKEFVADEA
jgi:hypothetical protein